MYWLIFIVSQLPLPSTSRSLQQDPTVSPTLSAERSENTGTSVDAKDDADGFVNPDFEPGVQRTPRPKRGAWKQASSSSGKPGHFPQCFQTVSSSCSIKFPGEGLD